MLFDRSWYNRAGVEKVMGFCTPEQVAAVPRAGAGVREDAGRRRHDAVQVLAGGDQDKQEERFAERARDPLKRWKLSPIDLKAREKYAEYGKARDEMFAGDAHQDAPWTVVDFNDQRRGRLNLIRDLLDRLPDTKVPPTKLDFPKLKGKAGGGSSTTWSSRSRASTAR